MDSAPFLFFLTFRHGDRTFNRSRVLIVQQGERTSNKLNALIDHLHDTEAVSREATLIGFSVTPELLVPHVTRR